MNVVMYFTNKSHTFKNHIIKIEIQMISKNDFCNKLPQQPKKHNKKQKLKRPKILGFHTE